MTNAIIAEGLVRTALQRLKHTHPFHAEVASYFGVHPGKSKTIGAFISDHEVEIVFNPDSICKMKNMDAICKALLKVIKQLIAWAQEEDEEEKASQADNDKMENGKNVNTPEQKKKKGDSSGESPDSPDGASEGKTDSQNPTLPANSVQTSLKSKIRTLIKLAAAETNDTSDASDDPNQTQGLGSAGQMETVITDGKYKLQWKKILSRYQGSARDKIRTRFYPNRRMPHLLGIVHGVKRVFRKPRIMIALDTSGSMGKKELQIISRECTFFKQMSEVLVVECDCAIQRIYKFKKAITKVKGRGGTSFVPPLETALLRKHRIELVIYFTDGYGDAPEKQPIAPVIWCLLGNKAPKPATYGRVVRYN